MAVQASRDDRLNETQQRILDYLRTESATNTYFKSYKIAGDLDLSSKEVGCNMSPLIEGDFGIRIERWGYSKSSTWKVTED